MEEVEWLLVAMDTRTAAAHRNWVVEREQGRRRVGEARELVCCFHKSAGGLNERVGCCFIGRRAAWMSLVVNRLKMIGLDCSEEDLMGIEFWSESMMVWMS